MKNEAKIKIKKFTEKLRKYNRYGFGLGIVHKYSKLDVFYPISSIFMAVYDFDLQGTAAH